MATKRHGGPIDPYSEFTLHDIVNGEASSYEDTFEYYGFHLIPNDEEVSEYIIVPDGHCGMLTSFSPDEFDDVLELVAYLNKELFQWLELSETEQIDAAGKLGTHDKSRVEDDPDKWVYIPKDLEA